MFNSFILILIGSIYGGLCWCLILYLCSLCLFWVFGVFGMVCGLVNSCSGCFFV